MDAGSERGGGKGRDRRKGRDGGMTDVGGGVCVGKRGDGEVGEGKRMDGSRCKDESLVWNDGDGKGGE